VSIPNAIILDIDDLHAEIARLHETIRKAGETTQALIDQAAKDERARGTIIDKVTAAMLRAELMVKTARTLVQTLKALP
jgi:hypothetical protein